MQEITVYDKNGNSLNTLVQWDENVVVYITDALITAKHRVHFFNNTMNYALVAETEYEDGTLKAYLPNILLTQAYPITGYVYVENGTEYRSLLGFQIQVRKKIRPDTYVYKENSDYVRAEILIDECSKYAKMALESAQSIEEQKPELVTATQNALDAAAAANIAAENANNAINISEKVVTFSDNTSTDDFASGETLSVILSKIQNRINLLMEQLPTSE